MIFNWILMKRKLSLQFCIDSRKSSVYWNCFQIQMCFRILNSQFHNKASSGIIFQYFLFYSVFLARNVQSLEAKQKSPLREKDDLVLICSAQGSSETTFSWYKNGFLLNVSRSIRLVFTVLFLCVYSFHRSFNDKLNSAESCSWLQAMVELKKFLLPKSSELLLSTIQVSIKSN